MNILSFFFCASIAFGAAPLVTFVPPPGSTLIVVSTADQVRIRRVIQDMLIALEGLSGVAARPVKVQVFGTREEYVTATQVPPDFGAVTQYGVIRMQPLAMLDHHQGLRRILQHEAVHHHFYLVGKYWPRNFHEALAHYLSGAPIAPSPRAEELAGRPRTGAEEAEYEGHLAWVLAAKIKPVGVRVFLHQLVRGEIDLSAFRRPRRRAVQW